MTSWCTNRHFHLRHGAIWVIIYGIILLCDIEYAQGKEIVPPMKLLIFSDSHGYLSLMEEAVRREKPDRIVHLGDYFRDGEELRERFPEIPMTQVAGNCDRFNALLRLPETGLERWEGVRFLLTHGHLQNVKRTLLPLELTAREQGADVALFGHTHVPFCRMEQGVLLFNPGTCGSDRGTYGRMILEAGGVTAEICTPERESEGEEHYDFSH